MLVGNTLKSCLSAGFEISTTLVTSTMYLTTLFLLMTQKRAQTNSLWGRYLEECSYWKIGS